MSQRLTYYPSVEEETEVLWSAFQGSSQSLKAAAPDVTKTPKHMTPERTNDVHFKKAIF